MITAKINTVNNFQYMESVFMRRLVTLPIFWLSITFIALGLSYTWATPPLEASDEYWHFGMVEFIHNNHALPVQNPDALETLWKQEGSQPPLYYILAAALISPLDISDADDYRILNPHARIGQPGSHGNKNLVLHDVDGDSSGDTQLAMYAIRLFSIALGTMTIIATYSCARILAPDRPQVALLATGMLALNPMFIFISSSINNDNLVITLSSIIIYLMLVMLRDGFDLRRGIFVSVLIALAALTKLSGLVLIPVVALAALWVAYRDQKWRELIIFGITMIAFWALIAGWWYLRNIDLYGELFGTTMMVKIAGARPDTFTLKTALDEFEGFRWSFWGVFGTFNVIVPYNWFYSIFDIISISAMIGLMLKFKRLIVGKAPHGLSPKEQSINLLSLCLLLLIAFIAFLQWTAQTYASQGRLLFPYVAAIMLLMASGLLEITGKRSATSRLLMSLILLFMGFFAIMTPFTVIAPAYAITSPLESVPDEAIPVFARYGDVELIAYETDNRRYFPSDTVPITLYWHVVEQSEQNNSIFLTFTDPDGNLLGKIDTYPGGGSLRSSAWQPGAIYADEYQIELAERSTDRLLQPVSEAFLLRLHVGWWNYPTATIIPAQDENEQVLDAVMLGIGGFGAKGTLSGIRMFGVEDALFADSIRLYGYVPHGDHISLFWLSEKEVSEDYTVFVQILDANNNRLYRE
jgi:hypothetical protein